MFKLLTQYAMLILNLLKKLGAIYIPRQVSVSFFKPIIKRLLKYTLQDDRTVV